MDASKLIVQVAQAFFLIALSPAFLGLANFLKAKRGQGRNRPLRTILQPYWNLRNLVRQPSVRPATTTPFFSVAPSIAFVACALLAFSVPVFYPVPLLEVDLVFVIYILALARFSLSLAGLDSGTAFGGLGSSREMYFLFLTEVSFALFSAALALQWGTLNISSLYQREFLSLNSPNLPNEMFQRITNIFLASALGVIILLEANRLPVSNRESPLELTQDTAATSGQYGGRDLALIESGELIKFGFLITLLGRLFLSFGIIDTGHIDTNIWSIVVPMTATWFMQVLFLLGVLSVWEWVQPKLRLRSVRGLANASMLLSVLAIFFILFTGR